MKKREFIVQDLLSKIYQEEFKDGKLPNQRKLAEIYHVSRFTIQQAIKNLEEIGIVRVVQGSGIFIHEKWVKNPLIFNSLTRTPYDRIHSKMIGLNQAPATADEQKIFQLDEGADVWTFERVRIVDYKIEQLEMSKMPVAMFPDLSQEVIEHSIQRYVEQKGYRISHYITSYDPITTSKEQSKILLCKRGTPAMQITNRAILEDGQVYEYSSIIAIDYSVTYIRPFDREIHRSRID
ncbi:regulatory protein GntR, HTH [Enterococcus mundtii 1A]|uniref:GntR family transcriptional regulator n=1 Tax=Enterococcus mundtii TaxID=53346 RepID=UPI000445D5D4|nr:GntR family transcriptional regulator [Enterococcus mundtii]EYT94608.1 GntR family transcriptional regulator [Enterococcus mundtii CRL35]MDA9429784.1 regulatory protein GntR, HTH [Enterococcus mundtii 1A]MDO7879457.1 GntR family transcriptional regulator [Enterococcus mundtii]